ncbi:MAG TPA: OmpH family outer membrane protein [Phycisphaerales bacterium]|nr:OmpH family outer membrane protein [Phycisphaerales bacterium]
MSSITRSLTGGAIVAAALLAVGLRPATGTLPAAPEAVAEVRIGTVDTLSLLERLMETEAYRLEREQHTTSWNDQLKAMSENIQALEARLIAMTPQDPAAQEVYGQYQSQQQAIQELQQRAYADVDEFSARQLADGYRKLHEACNRVATERGYTHVVSTRLATDDLREVGTNVLLQEVMIRPLLRAPAGDDLTNAIAEALQLPEVQPEPPAHEPEDAMEEADEGR